MKNLTIALVTVAVFGLTSADAAEYLENPRCRRRAPSRPRGGGRRPQRSIWPARPRWPMKNGANIAGNFEAQTRTIFKLMDRTLQRAGGALKNLVTMTVFITDVRNGDRFVEIRKEMFPDGNFPASALITVTGRRAAGHADRDSGHRRDRRQLLEREACTKK
jgi:hypothetical protein